MPQLFDNVRLLVEDFKTSWYFRIWSLFWVVCAILAFVCLIILGMRSTEAQKEKDWNTWFENASSIEFPNFRFKLLDPQDNFIVSSINCTHGPLGISYTQCRSGEPMTRCFAVSSGTVNAFNQWDEPFDNYRITCAFNTTGTAAENQMVAWEVENAGNSFNARPYHTTLIGPNNNMWVMLEKVIIKPLHTDGFIDWQKKVVHHSTVHEIGYYRVSTFIQTFRVAHFEQQVSYNGWMAMGGFGGFAFFLLILHTMVMIIAGFVLTNDSKFLHRSGGDSEMSERIYR